MIVHYTLPHDAKPTPEQLAEIRALKNRPIVFDEDCPEITPERYARMLRDTEKHNREKRERQNA